MRLGLAHVQRSVCLGHGAQRLRILAEITRQSRQRRFCSDAYLQPFDEEAGA